MPRKSYKHVLQDLIGIVKTEGSQHLSERTRGLIEEAISTLDLYSVAKLAQTCSAQDVTADSIWKALENRLQGAVQASLLEPSVHEAPENTASDEYG